MCDCSNDCHICSGCRRHARKNGCRGVLHFLRLVLLHVACTCNCFDTDMLVLHSRQYGLTELVAHDLMLGVL
jgi:hypothetical protein